MPGKKRRDCPALNRVITSAECGSQRGSRLACPASCAYFPFGTESYDLWLRLDLEWVSKALEFLTGKLGRETLPALVRKSLMPLRDERLKLEAAIHQLLIVKLFIERDPAGRTLGETWEAAGLPGLNNDEQVMTRFRRHTRVTVIEVERVVGEQSFLCRDLFEPDRPAFVVFDRAGAPRMVRFTRLLTWLTHYPHFSRLSVPAFEVPHHVWRVWETRVRAEFTAACADTPGLTLNDFLSLNLGRCVELIYAVTSEYADQLSAKLDVQQCLAAYKLLVSLPEIEAVLRDKPEFRLDEAREERGLARPLACYNWMRVGESAALEQELAGVMHLDTSIDGVGTVGVVRLYPERALVETLSKTKHAFARRMFERFLAGKVEFESEGFFDLAKEAEDERRQEATVSAAQRALFADDEDGDDPVAQVGRGEPQDAAAAAARREALRQEHVRNYERFLEHPTDVLDGKSPRAAAADPGLRPRLVDMMKSHIHGLELRNREEGTDLKLDSILDALGMPELR